MKQVFQKILSITMALLLLLSTTSWKVEKHYCMGRLIDVALFSDVSSCGMDMSLMNDNTSENLCCDDEVIVMDGQDDLKLSINDLDTNQQSFLIAFSYSYINLFQVQAEQRIPIEQYPPPLIVKDIQLLDNAFLI